MARRRKRLSGSQVLADMQRGARSAIGSDLDWEYWDKFTVSTTILEHRLFTVPLGQASKTIADTNLRSAGVLPNGEKMRVYEIAIQYSADSQGDSAYIQSYYEFLKNTSINVLFSGKATQGQWLASRIMGIPQLITIIPTVAGDNVQLNTPDFNGTKILRKKILIPALQTFEVVVQNHIAPNSDLAGDECLISLIGRLDRLG